MPPLPVYTTIIHGPQACGKTRNGERIRKAYGCSEIVDDWTNRDKIEKGKLHLTQEPRRRGVAEIEHECGFPIRYTSFAVAMEMVKISEEET